jgi:hypothetical protein
MAFIVVLRSVDARQEYSIAWWSLRHQRGYCRCGIDTNTAENDEGDDTEDRNAALKTKIAITLEIMAMIPGALSVITAIECRHSNSTINVAHSFPMAGPVQRVDIPLQKTKDAHDERRPLLRRYPDGG